MFISRHRNSTPLGVLTSAARLAALMTCALLSMCHAAFPVELVINPADEERLQGTPADDGKKTPEKPADQKPGDSPVVLDKALEAQAETDEKPVAAKNDAPAADQPVVDRPAAVEKAKPVQVRKGIVRQKAAVVAQGAAVAVEEVGEIIGDLLGGLFGGRGDQPQAAQLDINAVKQFEQQHGPHFDQVIRTELHFIRVVCNLTRQQYEAIEADAKPVRTIVLRRFAMVQQGMEQGQPQDSDQDTRKPIAEKLLVSVKRNLSPEQVSAYERELLARQQSRKELAILTTASKLDRKLVLRTQQREQVTTLLDENWNDSWGSIPMLLYGGEQFPNLPDQKLLPILTDSQKKIWRTVSQQSQTSWGFIAGMMPNFPIGEEQWDDADAEEKPADAAPIEKESK